MALTRLCPFCLEPARECVCPEPDDPAPAVDPPVEEDVLYHVGGDEPPHHGPACIERMSAPAEGAAEEKLAVVELRFADEEPVRSFIAAVSRAYDRFAEASPEDLRGLPAAIADGILGLQEAVSILVGPVLPPPAGTREESPYRGVISIEWPPPGASPYSSMLGSTVSVFDAATGKQITTCSEFDITVHADAAARVTAELTLFAGADGEPLLGGMPEPDGDEIRTGAFVFAVHEMRVRGR